MNRTAAAAMTVLVLLVGGCTADDGGDATTPTQVTEPGAPVEDPSAIEAQDPPGATDLPPVEETEG